MNGLRRSKMEKTSIIEKNLSSIVRDGEKYSLDERFKAADELLIRVGNPK